MDELRGSDNLVDVWRRDRSEEEKKPQSFRLDTAVSSKLDELCQEEEISKSRLLRSLVRNLVSQHVVYSEHRGLKEALAVRMLEDVKDMYGAREEVEVLIDQALRNIDSFRE